MENKENVVQEEIKEPIVMNNQNDRGFNAYFYKQSKNINIWKKIALFVIGCIGILFVSMLGSLIASSIGLQTQEEYKGAANFITYGILFVVLIGVLNVDIKLLVKDRVIPSIFIGIGIGFAMIFTPVIYRIIVNLFYNSGVNDNEAGLRSFINIYPLASLFILGIIGPICEELTYRVGLFGVFKNHRWVGYVVSILVFSFMHFSFDSANIVNEFINLPVYMMSAAFLAVAYDLFGFYASLAAHITNNVYAVLTVLLASALGIQ